jgi:DNA-binding NarL/FixJ family response regulator
MKKIFVVEDHEVMRAMLKALIARQPGMELCGDAETAPNALAAIPACAPDLVLVDVSLPGMSGIDLVERLRTEQPGLPALVLTGHDEAVYAGQALDAGARGFMMKGDPFAIMTAAQSILDGNYYVNGQVSRHL